LVEPNFGLGATAVAGGLSCLRRIRVRQPLAVIPLALDTTQAINIDLEQTYHQAAKRAYLD